MKLTTTLSALRSAGACFSGYNRVVRALQGVPFAEEDGARESYLPLSHGESIPLLSILESNGLDDALWALRCVPNCDRDARLYAVWCARQVQHLMHDPRSLNALDVAERFANGEATKEELEAAEDAARAATQDATQDAAEDVARSAAGDAAGDAARAAAKAVAKAVAEYAARVAAWAAARDAQKEMFIAMCNGNAPWQRASK